MAEITNEMIGMDETEYTEIKNYLIRDRFFDAKVACKQWIYIGKVIKRIKAAKKDHQVKGKLPDLVCDFFQHELKKDEIATSQKLADNEELILKWFVESGCSRTTPRAIWSEYNKGEKSEKKSPREKCDKVVETVKNTLEKNFPYVSLQDRREVLENLNKVKAEMDAVFAEQLARIRSEYHDLIEEENKQIVEQVEEKRVEQEEIEELAKAS